MGGGKKLLSSSANPSGVATWASMSACVLLTCALTLLVQGAFMQPLLFRRATSNSGRLSTFIEAIMWPQSPSQASSRRTSDDLAACDDWTATPRDALAKGSKVSTDDPWERSKWVPRVSACPVSGLPIEELEPDFNFRRGFALGFTDDVEDKTHLLPFMRVHVDPAMRARGRRILLDLGANKFHTSVEWFLRMYPLDFTEVHAFEAVEGRFVIPAALTDQEEMAQHAPEMDTWSRLRLKRAGPAPLPNWSLNRIRLHRTLVGTQDAEQSVNITRWMLEDLKLTEEDTVVVKMDIEGMEWSVLHDWLDRPGMERIVDELYVEVHYSHPSMAAYSWTPKYFPAKREDATQLLNRLRAAGFFVHGWP